VADPQAGKLSVRTKLLYGVGDVGNAVVNSAVQFFLLIFYTDAALLSPALVGSAPFVGKLWDAINDPIAGWLTDRMSSPRFGKRRVFMIFGAVRLAISIMLLWFVPQGLSPPPSSPGLSSPSSCLIACAGGAPGRAVITDPN
jgi:glycoside/pentoside/hexuronide:cation symporter, GPH family